VLPVDAERRVSRRKGTVTTVRDAARQALEQYAPKALIARVSVTHEVREPICRDVPRTRRTRACRRARAVKERPGNLAARRAACVSAVLDSRSTRQPRLHAGRTKRCSRPNQKIAQKRRTECGQIRYPDPKTSPLHEIGASPQRACNVC
jgi:hypothetical protein